MRLENDKSQLENSLRGSFALILGASSGFGAATAVELARAGVHIFGVHLDRRNTMSQVEAVKKEIENCGVTCRFFNLNAAASETRQEVIQEMKSARAAGKNETSGVLCAVLHSLAFGSLKPFLAEDAKGAISQSQIDMTLDVMAHSLIYWTQDLLAAGLLKSGAKVFAMTSAGSHGVWPQYGAVSAAKAALESHVRQLAFELVQKGIAVNAIQAGVTDTPALRRLPDYEFLLDISKKRNPGGRLTQTKDVAVAISHLTALPSTWLTGNVIRVDGGEDLVG